MYLIHCLKTSGYLLLARSSSRTIVEPWEVPSECLLFERVMGSTIWLASEIWNAMLVVLIFLIPQLFRPLSLLIKNKFRPLSENLLSYALRILQGPASLLHFFYLLHRLHGKKESMWNKIVRHDDEDNGLLW
ncbi:uncharacterized protein LOC130739880 isoform X1 [Lotus japonicus]|uniref:uncharacterized protein LOC130727006 isoform X1 n=1 Tax=Lotus japonicus TaxID=34305 RepID=UPI002583C93B|nr:uncharacterized protein LOC130727006 isoform X1 [Lotus japonicus]XP_057448319.1 uncharacterized protein LOC130739880 isoform X1 [Lotus japonicus]